MKNNKKKEVEIFKLKDLLKMTANIKYVKL